MHHVAWMRASTLALLVISTLTACGGGGGGLRPSASEIRTLTGASAPVETPAAQGARAPAIVQRADSVIISTIYGDTSHPALPEFRIEAQCTGIECTLTEPTTGFTDTLSLSDFELVAVETEAIGTRHGITVMSASGRDMDGEYLNYGAWMHHGGFTIEVAHLEVEDLAVGVRQAFAGGDLTGSAPTGSATWLGVMVGTPATGSRRGDRLQGVAALNYDLEAGGGLDIAFSSIKNIDRNAAHSTATVLFADVPIDSGGTFQAGFPGNRVQGGFYGPDHVEAAGVFEQSNIVGAFGAIRQ